jgi:hypothetical protein
MSLRSPSRAPEVTNAPTARLHWTTGLRALFQQRVAGDDALLGLAQLRFAQAGMGAEVYADTPEQLDRILGFAPSDRCLPVVHLNRGVNLLDMGGRALVEAFASRFAGTVAGLVVHDKTEMAIRDDELMTALRDLDAQLGVRSGPVVYLEYAAGHDLGWFAGVAERMRGAERVGFCVDVGHVGIRHARSEFSRTHPELDLAGLRLTDPRLPELVHDVQAAVEAALPAVLELTRHLGQTDRPLHFHLHDGHPLIEGLSDHFSFLLRVPVPFNHEGRQSLAPMYGPSGLAALVQGAAEAVGAERLSLTLEIHQVEGRLPLGDAARLFEHWRNLTNAERMNHYLSVLADNYLLLTTALHDGRSLRP